jgi:hypothetical protein
MVIEKHHDVIITVHPGRARIYSLLATYYWFEVPVSSEASVQIPPLPPLYYPNICLEELTKHTRIISHAAGLQADI